MDSIKAEDITVSLVRDVKPVGLCYERTGLGEPHMAKIVIRRVGTTGYAETA